MCFESCKCVKVRLRPSLRHGTRCENLQRSTDTQADFGGGEGREEKARKEREKEGTEARRKEGRKNLFFGMLRGSCVSNLVKHIFVVVYHKVKSSVNVDS